MPPPSPPSIQVIAITVSPDLAKRPKNLASGELRIGPQRHKLIYCGDGRLRQEFPNVIELSPNTQITLRYKTLSCFFPWQKTQRIDVRQLLMNPSTGQTQVTYDGFRVAFNCQAAITALSVPNVAQTVLPTTRAEGTLLSLANYAEGSLFPTTQGILEDCPRFRILVIGKSGVGKSSLIHTAFGVNKAHISDLERGRADIHVGLESCVNERFILHDSLGFEPGDEDNYKTVKEFIQSRQTGALRDQLHAIWFCVQVPLAGGRLLETAAEDFFRTKKDTIGTIPLIVVYTKLDSSVYERVKQLAPSHRGLDTESLKSLARSDAESNVRERHNEINQLAKEPLPYTMISTKANYEYTSQNLVDLTYRQVLSRGTPGAQIASMVTLMAQRVDPTLKIQGSIDVGRQRYWKALRASPDFRGHTIWDCLSVIHTDIVAVWNFNDPSCHLLDSKFKELTVEMVKKLEMTSNPNPNRILALGGGSLVAAVSGFLAAIANPAAPIVLPIVAGVAAVVWLYDVYQNVRNVQQIFMAYIVDLTHIMEALFILTARDHSKLSRRAIKIAYSTYITSGLMSQTHTNIQSYRELEGRDAALDMIESLIKPEECGDSGVKDYYAEISKLDLRKHQLDQEEEW